MLGRLILFEIGYHQRQVSFRAAALVFALMGYAVSQARFGADVPTNAPFTVAIFTGLLSLGSVIAVSLLVPGAILRDRAHRMDAIVFSTNTTHSQFLISRFTGLVIASVLVFSPALLGMFLGSVWPLGNPDRFAPPTFLPYLWSLVVVAVPNILSGAAVLFATAASSRSASATFISGVVLYILYWVGSMLGNSPIIAGASLMAAERAETAGLLDPYGLVAMMEQARYWSVAEKTTRLLALDGTLLANRLLWSALAFGLFAMTYRLFGFRSAPDRPRPGVPLPPVAPRTIVPAVRYRPPGPLRAWRSISAHAGVHILTLLRGFTFPVLLLVWIFFMAITAAEGLESLDLGLRFLPMSAVLIQDLVTPLRGFGSLIVVFYATETVWRERDHRVDALVGSTANPPFVFWFGKLIALAAVIAALVLTTALVAVAVQLLHGGHAGDLWRYLELIPRAGLPLIMAAVLAVAVLELVPNKYAGMGLSFLIVVLLTGLITTRSLLGLHPVFRFAHLPELIYSPMVGGGYADPATVWYLIYWLAWTLLLVTLTLLLRRRGDRLRLVRPGAALTTIGAGALIAASA